MPKVSICIPTYKQVDYLRKTLDSVLLQDYEDYEVIITDDSPNDSVKQLVELYDFKGKLSYYKNKVSLGSPENWNEAVRKASGKYIKMLHHDDYFTFSYSLGDYVTMLEEHPNVDFAFSATQVIHVSGNKTWIHAATKQQQQDLKKDPKCLFFGNLIGAPSATIYKKNPVKEYDRNLKWVVDFDFYIQRLMINNSFVFSEKPLISTTSGTSHSITNECENNGNVEVFEYLYLFDKLFKNRFIIEKKYFSFFRKLFNKYNIKSIKEIKKIGYNKRLPFLLKLFLYFKELKYSLS